jgi:hypothetical protein
MISRIGFMCIVLFSTTACSSNDKLATERAKAPSHHLVQATPIGH